MSSLTWWLQFCRSEEIKNHSLLSLICLAVISTANAQDGPSGKTLASTMDVYVFPNEGQAADQQSKDEASCYEWAVGNSGSDPFELQQQQVAQAEQTEEAIAAAEQTGRGAGARRAVRGAVAGDRRPDRKFQESVQRLSRSQGLPRQILSRTVVAANLRC